MKAGINLHRATFAALAAMVACGESDAPPGPRAVETDSAGIGIVTSPPVDAVYARLAAQPALTVGEADGPEEYLFGRIASVARDGEANLVVADGRAGEVRIFDPRGRHLRTVGGTGEGPGEFGWLGGAWPVPEGGIVAVDGSRQRIARFGADGSLTGTADLAGVGEMGIFATRGMAGAGMVLSQVTELGVPTDAETSARDLEETLEEGSSVLFIRHGLDGGVVDTLARRPGQKSTMSTSGSGDMAMVQVVFVPFSPLPSAAGSPRAVAVTGGGLYEVALFDAAGEPSRILRLDEIPVPRTDEHLEALVRSPGRRVPDEESVRAMMDMYRDMPMPERLPAYSGLVFADTGELWARRYLVPGGETAHWDVFGANGHHLGRVEVPASLRIQEVSRGQVVGIATGELGVERVEVLDLIFG
ncbi:MAG: hypothetical protein OXK74_00880 [Gemmatimonadota bacterium]|nr:hypothetical protein [Gemmatimonadota bacterium]